MSTVSESMYQLGSKRSSIRELFEYGRRRKAEIGAENVYDFSLGNPNVAPPACVNQLLKQIIDESDPTALHGYTSAPGDPATRQAVCDSLNRRYGTRFSTEQIYMTCGAAASLCCCLAGLACPGDEFVLSAPFIPQYTVFTGAVVAPLRVVSPLPETFQIDLAAMGDAINEHTKAVLINSPNNPSGVVYTAQTIRGLCDLLRERSAQYGHPIFLISDEPYREIVYDGVELPCLVKEYAYTLICYSYSKSLSLPGERIGYVAVSYEMPDWKTVYAAVMGAGRALGYVCAPALFQKLVARMPDETADMDVYRQNRDLLVNSLRGFGYTCIPPQGAFYLFVKAPEPDANAFCERAKQFELLLVPGDDFGCPGYVRISYCVSTDQIRRSLPAFEKLMETYQKG